MPHLSSTAGTDPGVVVDSAQVSVDDRFLYAQYCYQSTRVSQQANAGWRATPVQEQMTFRTERRVQRLGLMMVGWGGNNGSTLTASILANKHGVQWRTKDGLQQPNYFGSLVMASTLWLGLDENNADVYVPFQQLLPMADPNQLVLGGWDISSANLAEAMQRACVLDWDLQSQLSKHMAELKPLPSVYEPDFIAGNQMARADNVIPGPRSVQLARLRADIREFKSANALDRVVVVWTANTERYSQVIAGVHDTADALLSGIEDNHTEISPSTLFATAAILEGCPFVNGSPQNTFVPGVLALAERENVFIGGDDFKSGQTKLKSVLVDFLVNAGIKPTAITSYNHLGNNDGKNLAEWKQFRSKEISKTNVVDDMVAANPLLYKPGEHPDHTVVIKYVPSVGDSKRAMDEYVSKIFMNGTSTIAIHNTCEDSLLASPLILDLVLLTELFTRISVKREHDTEWRPFHPVLSLLSYMLKAPISRPDGGKVVNALGRQRLALENVLRACAGLGPRHDMDLHDRV